MTLTVSATDDRTAADALGYELTVASGTLPEGLTLPEGPVLAPGGRIYLHWGDGASDDQEPIDVVLTVAAVDLAGNRGATAPVAVTDPD